MQFWCKKCHNIASNIFYVKLSSNSTSWIIWQLIAFSAKWNFFVLYAMQLLCLFSRIIFALLQKVSSSVEKREIYSHLKYFVKIAFTISRIFFCLQKNALMGVNSCNFHTVSPKSFLTPKIKHWAKLSLQNFYHYDSSLCNFKSYLANNFSWAKISLN